MDSEKEEDFVEEISTSNSQEGVTKRKRGRPRKHTKILKDGTVLYPDLQGPEAARKLRAKFEPQKGALLKFVSKPPSSSFLDPERLLSRFNSDYTKRKVVLLVLKKTALLSN